LHVLFSFSSPVSIPQLIFQFSPLSPL
jgi:hypothetical protein